MMETKYKREGTHFVEIDPAETTGECANCGVETDKPLWVREQSCPACVFEADRDTNAAWNILLRGLATLGVSHSEETPVKTALPTSPWQCTDSYSEDNPWFALLNRFQTEYLLQLANNCYGNHCGSCKARC